MVDDVYVDKVGFTLHLTCQFGRVVKDKDANEFIQLKGVET